MAGAADLPAAVLASNELLVTLDATERATNFTLTEDGLHLVSVDTTVRSWTNALLCQAPQPAHREFPYLNILGADLTTSDKDGRAYIEIRAHDLKQHEGVAVVRGLVQKDQAAEAEGWVGQLLAKAYPPGTSRGKRLRVLINPAAGAGKAKAKWIKQVEPIFRSAGCALDVTYTTSNGHATTIARELDLSKYDAIVPFSGDGLIYEVVNGFGARPDACKALRECPIGVLPGGSGNALSCSLNGPKLGVHLGQAALTIIKGKPLEMDICSITQGDRRSLSFCSQAYGLMADVDLGTENLRWMGGNRFIVGFIQRAIAGPYYECEISMRILSGDKEAMKAATFSRSGGHPGGAPGPDGNPFTDAAASSQEDSLPPLKFGTVNDPIPNGPDISVVSESKASGWTTVNAPVCTMYAGTIPYLASDLLQFPIATAGEGSIVVSILPVVSTATLLGAMDGAASGKHYDLAQMEYYKVEAFRLSPKPNKTRFPNFISIDGEHTPFEPFQVEAHPRLGRVLSLRDSWFLPKEWTQSPETRST